MISDRMRQVYGDSAKPANVAYACLCPAGQRLTPAVLSISNVASEHDLRRLFPRGLPERAVGWRSRLEQAGVGRGSSHFSLDTYRDEFGVDAACMRFYRLGSEWARVSRSERSDLVLFGPNGTTKTGLAVSLLRASVERGDTVRFLDLATLAQLWRETFDDRSDISTSDLTSALVDVDVLVVDEVGGGNLTDFVTSTLTMLVNRRQQNARPTVLTLNVPAYDAAGAPIEDLNEYLLAMFGPTLFDRLRERAQFWPMVGGSRRKRPDERRAAR